MPKAKMLPGTCYVWRVWPILGRARYVPLARATVSSHDGVAAKAEAKRRAARAGGENSRS